MPSTCQLAILNPGPRPESRGSPVASSTVVDTPYLLFSIKKQIGKFHAAAKFNVSSTDPIFTAPSPKYVTETASEFDCL